MPASPMIDIRSSMSNGVFSGMDHTVSSVAVAPPGRYPSGAGRYGHRDLLGNVLEITAQPGVATLGTKPWGRNGGFETAHFDANTMLGWNGYAFVPLTKYGRAGGRCARPTAVYLPAPLP